MAGESLVSILKKPFNQLVKDANKLLNLKTDSKLYWDWCVNYLELCQKYVISGSEQPHLQEALTDQLGYNTFRELVESGKVKANGPLMIVSNPVFTTTSGGFSTVTISVGRLDYIDNEFNGNGQIVPIMQLIKPVSATNLTSAPLNRLIVYNQPFRPDSTFTFPLSG